MNPVTDNVPRGTFNWRKRNIRRDNFASFAEIDDALSEARAILRRKTSTPESLRHAGVILLMAVRTLRSWHGARCETIRHLKGLLR